MSGSLRHRTIKSSLEIFDQLRDTGNEELFFECEIIVPSPRLDTVEDGTLTIDLKRAPTSANYVMGNGDRVYRTVARFTGDDREFDVDVIIRSRQADLVGATISMAGEALEISRKIQER